MNAKRVTERTPLDKRTSPIWCTVWGAGREAKRAGDAVVVRAARFGAAVGAGTIVCALVIALTAAAIIYEINLLSRPPADLRGGSSVSARGIMPGQPRPISGRSHG